MGSHQRDMGTQLRPSCRGAAEAEAPDTAVPPQVDRSSPGSHWSLPKPAQPSLEGHSRHDLHGFQRKVAPVQNPIAHRSTTINESRHHHTAAQRAGSLQEMITQPPMNGWVGEHITTGIKRYLAMSDRECSTNQQARDSGKEL